MKDLYIVRRGGGGGALSDAFAVIAVTYPVGSLCTCTNGMKTLKAKDTSGSYLFMIPEAGPWTVTATDGTRTASKQVAVDRLYQAESVKISYDLVLFDEGDEKTDITGGWLAQGKSGGSQGWPGSKPDVIKYDGYYLVKFKANAGGLYTTTNKIDLTEYVTLKMLWQKETALKGNLSFGAWDNSKIGMNGMQNTVARYGLPSAEDTLNADIETSLDISTVSGSWHVGLASYSAYTGTLTQLKKIWATKEGM